MIRLGLLRFGPIGAERPGVAIRPVRGDEQLGPLGPGCVVLDVSAAVSDYDEAFFAEGGLARLRAELAQDQSQFPEVPLAELRLGAPIARPSKLIGIGLNYRAHAAEMAAALQSDAELPDDPKLFMKATTAMSGVCDDLELPPGSSQVDYEVELALVIGRRTPRGGVSVDDARAYIAGFTICNDYSERDWQKNRHGQFVKGKSADGFAPLGPVLVPADTFDDASARLWLELNGEPRQDARTSEMIFDAPSLVSSISRYMTLLPGDVITTGTPAGVCMGREPPGYLKAGDIVEYGIDGIGSGRQLIR